MTPMLQRMGGNPYENSGDSTSTIFMFRGPVIQGPPGNLIPSQRHHSSLHTSHHNVTDRPPWFWRRHIPHLEILLWPMHPVAQNTSTFEWGPESCGRSGLRHRQPCHFMLQVWVLGADAMWHLWQAPVGESQPSHVVPCGSLARPYLLQGRVMCLLRNNSWHDTEPWYGCNT